MIQLHKTFTQSWWLTNGTDVATANVFTAGLVYTPGGNDRINALQDEDKLTGINSGADSVLNATLGNANDNGGQVITPELNDVRILNVAFTGSANNAVTDLDLQDATGVKEVNITRVTQATNTARIENIKQAVADLSVNNTNANNTGVVEFSYGAGTLAGDNTVALELNNVQLLNLNIGQNTSGVGVNGVGLEGYETINLSSTGSSNAVGVLNIPMDTGTAGKVVITGDKDLRLGTLTNVVNGVGTVESVNYAGGIAQPFGRLASVDAGELTGNLTLNMGAGFFTTGKADTSGAVQNVTVTGGKGNDKFILGDVIQAGDSLTGGDGTDTLVVVNGGTINAVSSIVSKIENVELRIDGGAGAGVATVDFDKLPDAVLVKLHNEASIAFPGAAAPVPGVSATFNLNNLTATHAAGLSIEHSNTGNNGITQNIINANLKSAAGTSDTVVLNINEGLNTDARFNVTLATQQGTFAGATSLVENVTLKNNDSESNTVALASNAQHTGTITLTSGANAAAAGTFINLDTNVAGRNGGLYQYNVAGAADLNSSNAGATVGRIADLSGDATQVRLSAGTIDAAAEAANVVVRVGSSPASVSVVGAQKITMGAGNDTVIFDNLADTRAGLTISDTVVGGAGSDTLVIDGNVAITLGASEWTNVSGFETLRVVGNGVAANNAAGATNSYNLTLTNSLLAANKDTNGFLNVVSDNDLFNNTGRTAAQAVAPTVTDADGVARPVANDAGLFSGGVTIDARSLSAGSKWSYKGNEGAAAAADRIILSDANFDGTAVIDGGALDNITNNRGIASLNGTSIVGNGAISNVGNADVIEVRNAAVVSQGDLANVKNIGTLSFTNDLAVTQVSTLQLNDSIVDNLVDSFQASVSRAAAATTTTGGANVERLQINAVDNVNVAAATTGLTIEAGTLTDKSDLDITLGRGANNVTAGAGNDRVVLLGNYVAGTYAATENGVSINAQSTAGAGVRVVTDTIALGTGTDTLVTYGAINLAGANLSGIENFVANSAVVLALTQFNALTSLTFTGNTAHQLFIVDDVPGANSIDLSKIQVQGGSLQYNFTAGDMTAVVNGVTTAPQIALTNVGGSAVLNNTITQATIAGSAVTPVGTISFVAGDTKVGTAGTADTFSGEVAGLVNTTLTGNTVGGTEPVDTLVLTASSTAINLNQGVVGTGGNAIDNISELVLANGSNVVTFGAAATSGFSTVVGGTGTDDVTVTNLKNAAVSISTGDGDDTLRFAATDAAKYLVNGSVLDGGNGSLDTIAVGALGVSEGFNLAAAGLSVTGFEGLTFANAHDSTHAVGLATGIATITTATDNASEIFNITGTAAQIGALTSVVDTGTTGETNLIVSTASTTDFTAKTFTAVDTFTFANALADNVTFTNGQVASFTTGLVGGSGAVTDVLNVTGNVTAAQFDAVSGWETINLQGTGAQAITAADAMVASGTTLTINNTGNGALTFNGDAEVDGQFVIAAGNGGATIASGRGIDTITLGSGADTITIGSNGLVAAARDVIKSFGATDKINIEAAATGLVGVALTGTDNFSSAASIATVATYGAGIDLTAGAGAAAEVIKLSGSKLNVNLATTTDANFTDGTALLAVAGAVNTAASATNVLFLIEDNNGNTGVYYGADAGTAGFVNTEIALIGVLQGVAMSSLSEVNFSNANIL